MSGHSKWSTIKRKKGAADAKRGKIFTKLIKEITVAARLGGGNPDANPRLRAAILEAKAENMPKENIERAIKKGVGEIDGGSYEEITYEGFGPGGVAIMVDAMTDNKNRTAAEVRHIFTKHGGNLGNPGSVARLFSKKGTIVYEKGTIEEDKLMEIALEAGAEDMTEDGNNLVITTDPKSFYSVKEAIERRNDIPKYIVAELSMIPQNTVRVTGKEAEQVLKLLDMLEESDDVQKVYSNVDIPDEEIERIKGTT
ncbi:MAG: YebC/PmpR family DNA-binding transcriptional regulator [Desulfobacterota bacterium]|nr:YebC/PmpR family DNA-binding transcriptional regulator [Thermodesulfobacteriota bacterium]